MSGTRIYQLVPSTCSQSTSMYRLSLNKKNHVIPEKKNKKPIGMTQEIVGEQRCPRWQPLTYCGRYFRPPRWAPMFWPIFWGLPSLFSANPSSPACSSVGRPVRDSNTQVKILFNSSVSKRDQLLSSGSSQTSSYIQVSIQIPLIPRWSQVSYFRGIPLSSITTHNELATSMC